MWWLGIGPWRKDRNNRECARRARKVSTLRQEVMGGRWSLRAVCRTSSEVDTALDGVKSAIRVVESAGLALSGVHTSSDFSSRRELTNRTGLIGDSDRLARLAIVER